MVPLWIAFIMGVVEGLTEYIPVSSTGHLIVTGALLGMQGEKAKTFEIFIQLGAVFAVVWFYRRKLLESVTRLADDAGARQQSEHASERCRMRAGAPRELVGAAWPVGEQVGDSERGGDVDRLRHVVARRQLVEAYRGWELVVHGATLDPPRAGRKRGFCRHTRHPLTIGWTIA